MGSPTCRHLGTPVGLPRHLSRAASSQTNVDIVIFDIGILLGQWLSRAVRPETCHCHCRSLTFPCVAQEIFAYWATFFVTGLHFQAQERLDNDNVNCWSSSLLLIKVEATFYF